MTTAPAPTARLLEPTPFPQVQIPTAILVDLFPAKVTLPPAPDDDGSDLISTISAARLIITGTPDDASIPDRLYVFTDSSVGPALLYSAQSGARTGSNREGTITTTEGTVTYEKDGGCGCGSALKSFAPFSHPYSVA